MKNGYLVVDRLEGTATPDLRAVTPHSFVLELTRRRTFWSPSALTMRDFSSAGRTTDATDAAAEVEAFLDAAAAFLGAIAHGQNHRRKHGR
jgi:hypothetical protein